MLTNSIITDDNYTRVSFGHEIEVMIGSCFEEKTRNEMVFSIGEGLLSQTHDGIRAAMVVFAELVMRRRCEVERGHQNITLKNLHVDHIATPASNLIRGSSGVVHQNNDAFFMKVLLHSEESLVMSITAVWSFDD